MKKISLKIILAIAFSTTIALVITGIVTLSFASSIVYDDTIVELGMITEREGLKFEHRMTLLKEATLTLDGLIEATFDVNRLQEEGSEEYIDNYKEELLPTLISISTKLKLLNLYIYFNPEIYKGGQLAIVDLERDGSYKRNENEYIISEADLSSPDLAWFTDPIKYGEVWTPPYFWEPYNMYLVSYSKPVYKDGTLICVIGSDHNVGELMEYFESFKLLETGSMFVLNEKRELIVGDNELEKELSRMDSAAFATFTEMLDSGKKRGEFKYRSGQSSKHLFYSVIDNGWIMSSSVKEGEILARLSKMDIVLIVLLLITIVVSTIVALIIGNSISRPIIKISESMTMIASGEGDLTAKIMVNTNDELATLADKFNMFVEKLQLIVNKIKVSAGNDSKISHTLHATVSESSSAISEISSNILSIKRQITLLNDNIHSSLDSTKQVTGSISIINGQIDRQVHSVNNSTASVEEMIASLNNVVLVTEKRLESAKRLVNTAKKGGEMLNATIEALNGGIVNRIGSINEMVKVINDISAQTNLLAMNASIEAAHAGESGRGFAVVAEEIRTMAESSAESSRAIKDVIKLIVKAIKETADNAGQTDSAFTDIEKEVHEMEVAFQEIAANTSEISVGGNEILQTVADLKEITTTVSSGVREIGEAFDRVNGAMNNIGQVSSEVLNGINEIDRGTKYIIDSIHEVSNLSGQLDSETEHLLEEVNRFKTGHES